MSTFAQEHLDAIYDSVIADDARVTPKSGADAFQVRVFPLQPDQTLGIGLQSQPILGTSVLEVRKTDWAKPERQDVVEILSDGSVTRTLRVVDEPMSIDDKRLVWTVNCAEA